MKNTQRRNILQYAFAIIIAICLSLSFSNVNLDNSAKAAEAMLYTSHVGEEIKAEDFKIYHQGEYVTAETLTIICPNGARYGCENYTFEYAGKYTVLYSAFVGDKKVESGADYLVVRRAQDLIVAEEGMSVEYGKYFVEGQNPKTNTYGALVSFKDGQSITFSSKIKTEKLVKDYNIFDLIVMPSVYGETDFEKLTIIVSDANDPNNYVEIFVESLIATAGEGMVSYVRAGANGQQVGGYEGSTYHQTSWGTQVFHSFRGYAMADGGTFDNYKRILSENSLTLSIDNAERKIYCGPLGNENDDNLLVNDLDDPAHYKSNPWGGFTSDEVVVKITAGGFVKSLGTVLIKKYAGYDFSSDIYDNESPEITLDYDLTGKLPVAEVGSPFPLFKFSAKDSLDEKLITKVGVFYLGKSGYDITVSTDGNTFTPKYEGQYKIVYRVEDYSRNCNEKIVYIDAVNVLPNIFIDVESLVTEEIFETVIIPSAEEIGVFGGSGKLTVERQVFDPDKKLVDVNDKLYLSKLGDYKVVYTVTDYLGRVEYGVTTITSQGTTAPKFIEQPRFESKLIKGFTYSIPTPRVINTINGEIVDVNYKVLVEDKEVSGEFVASGEDMNIRYVAEDGTVLYDITLSVVDTKYGRYKSEYFYSEDEVEITDQKDYVQFAFSKKSSVEFVNALSAENLLVSFSYEDGDIKFNNLKLIITESQNVNLKVTVEFIYDTSNNLWYIVSNDRKTRIAYYVSKNVFTFSYNPIGNKIIDTSGESIDVIKFYDNGDKFESFSSKVYLTFEFSDSKNNSQSLFKLTQLNNQSMGYIKSSIDKAMDEIEPVIVLNEDFLLRQKLGEKANVPTAKSFDVLGQIYKFTVSIEFNGNVVISGDATKPLDYTLATAGNYKVTYYAEDTNGNYKRLTYMIMVNDETAPTLTVKDNLKDKYKVGSKVKIPTYSAKDNGENCYIQVMLILPNNEMRLLHYSENGKVTSLLEKDNELYEKEFKADKNTFIVNQKGKYVLRILAYDEYYNYTVKEIEFIVK